MLETWWNFVPLFLEATIVSSHGYRGLIFPSCIEFFFPSLWKIQDCELLFPLTLQLRCSLTCIKLTAVQKSKKSSNAKNPKFWQHEYQKPILKTILSHLQPPLLYCHWWLLQWGPLPRAVGLYTLLVLPGSLCLSPLSNQESKWKLYIVLVCCHHPYIYIKLRYWTSPVVKQTVTLF